MLHPCQIKAREAERQLAAEAEVARRAGKGNFVGDVKILCCSGLPKVDYWGKIDP